MTSEILIQTEWVSRSYGGESILDGVTLAVRAGEITTIVGPSGSGKTTLLAILALLLEPTSGRVIVAGRDAGQLSDAERSQLRNHFYGFAFQTAQLVGSLSVLDNVLLPAILAGRARKKRDEAFALLERLGLAHREKFLPHQLSLGQRRRVALARALILEPRVVLADEPTNDLDARRADQIADFLLGLPKEGFAVVLVTHDPALAERAGNRYEIQRGKLRRLLAETPGAVPSGPLASPRIANGEAL